MYSFFYVECPHDLIQQSGTENWKYDVVFSLYKELFRWNGRLYNLLVYLHDAGTRNELGPVDVLKSCQGRWPVYFAQSPSTPPSPCITKSSVVQLNMQQPR